MQLIPTILPSVLFVIPHFLTTDIFFVIRSGSSFGIPTPNTSVGLQYLNGLNANAGIRR
jgi:hypothetical protein